MEFFNSFLPLIEQYHFLGYWSVLIFSLVESLAFIGIAIPGSTFIILIGFISSQGFLDLKSIILFATVGAIAGDAISYYLGSYAKKIFKEDNKIFKSKYLDKGKAFFCEYGGRSVFFGRFVGPIRPVIPFVAGMFKMDTKKFFLWNVSSGLAWATTFSLIGFFFGHTLENIVKWSAKGGWLAVSFIAFVLLLYIFKRLIIKKVE